MSLSIYQLKPRFQQILRPLLRLLSRTGITPNQVTLAAMGLSLAYGAALASAPRMTELWFALPLFMLLRMAMNAIDGMLAAATSNKTALGALLNEVCDQVSDAALYLPFALAAGAAAPLVVLVVVAALLAEFAGILGPTIGATRRVDGPMGKSDRAFVFSLLALLIGLGAHSLWINGLLALMLALAGVTIFNRLRQALLASEPVKP